MKIYKIFDNGGKTIDRYTVVFAEKQFDVSTGRRLNIELGLSVDPTWPLGFSQWGLCRIDADMGDEIKFSDLPENVQKHVLERMEED
jgi:hypothetical protein